MVFPMKTSRDTTILHYSLSKWNTNASKVKAEYQKGNTSQLLPCFWIYARSNDKWRILEISF